MQSLYKMIYLILIAINIEKKYIISIVIDIVNIELIFKTLIIFIGLENLDLDVFRKHAGKSV